MRHTLLCLSLVFTVGLTAMVSDAATAAKPAPVKTPAHMAGLDPKALGKPEDIVRRRWDAVMLVLRNEKIDPATKQSHVEDIVSPVFDFSAMTRLALGQKNWRKFTATQRKEFSKLFVIRLKESYGRRISDYGGEQVVHKPALKLKTSKPAKPATKPTDGPKIVHVPVEIVSKTRRWIILHKFRRIGEIYRIYDIEIEGISILRSYRSQFNDILRRGTPADLLARLRKPIPKTDPPAGKGGKQK